MGINTYVFLKLQTAKGINKRPRSIENNVSIVETRIFNTYNNTHN
jgi:hypothetical protein